MFLLFVHIIRLIYRQVCLISKGFVGVKCNNKIDSRRRYQWNTAKVGVKHQSTNL